MNVFKVLMLILLFSIFSLVAASEYDDDENSNDNQRNTYQTNNRNINNNRNTNKNYTKNRNSNRNKNYNINRNSNRNYNKNYNNTKSRANANSRARSNARSRSQNSLNNNISTGGNKYKSYAYSDGSVYAGQADRVYKIGPLAYTGISKRARDLRILSIMSNKPNRIQLEMVCKMTRKKFSKKYIYSFCTVFK